MPEPTPSTRLATVLLGKDLGEWVREQRADDRSWPWIANQLAVKTNHQVELSREHLRRLFGDKKAA